MVKRFSLVPAFALLFSLGAMAQDSILVIRVFTLSHIRAEEVVPLVRPLLSPQGSMTIQSRSNSLAVKDTINHLDAVEKIIKTLDVPPLSFRIAIKMVRANTVPSEKKAITGEIQGIGAQLRNVFPYQSYDILAKNTIEGLAGDVVSYRLNENYQVEFFLHHLLRYPAIIQLKNFKLYRIVKKGHDEMLRPILRTTINLRVNQTHVVGVSNSLNTGKAIIFIIRATQQ